MLVSVIIPTYNRRHLIGPTIDSVLAQTHRELEVVVVDDGSKDGTGEFLKTRYAAEPRFRYIWQENAERSAARNNGITAAKGEYVAFLDSDDLWLPDKLEQQVRLLQANPEMVMVLCWFECIDDQCEPVGIDQSPSAEDAAREDFAVLNVAQNRIGSPTPVVRRTVFEKTGLFCLDLVNGEDWELWTRIACYGRVGLVPKALARHRIHPGNTEKPMVPENYIVAVGNMKARLGRPYWERIEGAALKSYCDRLRSTPPRTLGGRIKAFWQGATVFGGAFLRRFKAEPWRETVYYFLGPAMVQKLRSKLHPELQSPPPPRS